MIGPLRLRVVALLAVFGALAAAASYVFGAPNSVALLVPGMALVAVVTLCLGVRAAAVTAVLASGGFLYVQLAGVQEPLVVDFGTGSAAIDLPALVHGAGATWLQTLLGVVALMIMLPVAGLLRNSLNASRSAERAVQTVVEDGAAVLRVADDAGFGAADEGSRSAAVAVAIDSVDPDGEGRSGDAFPLALLRAAHAAGFRPVNDILSSSASSEATVTDDPDGDAKTVRWTSQVAALVRVTLDSNPDGKRLPRVTSKRLADMVGAQLGGLRETAVVMSDDAGDVVMLLPGADDQRAHELVHQLEDTARRQFRRSLKSVVLALEAPGQTAEQPKPGDLETQLEGRPVGTRVSSREVRGGS